LLEKQADDEMPPSSMTKLMTIYLVYERLKQGQMKLDEELPVTERAWRMGGSKMFVQIGSTVKVEDLIRGVIVQSGNDACIVFAEAISGSVRAISDAVADTLEETPPELLADLMGRGITLAGGGALLPGLPELLARRVQMSVHVAEEPLGCVVRGTGRVLNELDTLRKVLLELGSPKLSRIR